MSIEEHGVITAKPSECISLIKTAMAANRPILLSARPGVGKSSLYEQVAQETEHDLITSHPVMADPTDFKGLGFAVTKNGETIADFLPIGEMGHLVRTNRPTLWLVDDVGNAPPAVQAALMRPLLERKVNMSKIPDNVKTVAATNRRSDKTGIFGILSSVMSRMGMSVEMTVDLDDWCRWALANGVRTDIIAHKRYRPDTLVADESAPAHGDMEKTYDPRAWHFLSDLLDNLKDNSLEHIVCCGAVGRYAGNDFLAFKRIYSQLPNIDEIIMNPAKFEWPEDPATAYALCGALAAKASENTFERIAKLVNKMPPEFSVLTVKDCLSKEPKIARTRPFIQWAADNADVVA